MTEQLYRVFWRMYDLDDRSTCEISKVCEIDIASACAYILKGKLTDLESLNIHCDYWLEPV